MNIQLFPHHPKCTPDYPEKPKGEPPQMIVKTDLGNGEIVFQCVDCGAHILTKEKSITNTNSELVHKVRQRLKDRKRNDKPK